MSVSNTPHMNQIQHGHKHWPFQSNILEFNKQAQQLYPSDLRATIHWPEETETCTARGSGLVTNHTPTTPMQLSCTLCSGKTPHTSAKSPTKSQTQDGEVECYLSIKRPKFITSLLSWWQVSSTVHKAVVQFIDNKADTGA